MYRKQVNEHSPLRILEQGIHGGLGIGNLGVVMARAGVGKTACLVQIGLDDLMRDKAVLHIAIDQTVEHVQSWYDALLGDLARATDLEDAEAVREMVQQRRIIATFTDHDLWPDRLQATVESFEQRCGFRPAAILLDGYPWQAHSQTVNAAFVGAFKSYAKLLGAELWMSAPTQWARLDRAPAGLLPPWDTFAELIDVAIYLEPHGADVSLRVLKDHDSDALPDTKLQLHPDTLRLVVKGEERRVQSMPTSAYTLLSGGAVGAEAAFGACAEEWGLAEVHYTFEGRNPARQRGLVRLTPDELAQGAVSQVYLQARLDRSFPDTQLFRKTLQSIWHQVSTAGEVFAVGTIQADGTVKGGTGWAVELGRSWHKPTYVFDQAQRRWYLWDDDDAWQPIDPPVIHHRRFAGTGTRELDDAGRAAIRSLFERSFGEPPALARSA